MKKIVIFYDLHDTLIKSEVAWLRSFKKYSKKNYSEIKKNYNAGISRKLICKIYDLDYDIVKEDYRKNLRVNFSVAFLLKLFSQYPQYIISNGSASRVQADLEFCNLDNFFEKIYTKEHGVKPDQKYIEKIIKTNKIDYAIMIGNKSDEDIFFNSKVSSYLIKGIIYNLLLFFKIKIMLKNKIH